MRQRGMRRREGAPLIRDEAASPAAPAVKNAAWAKEDLGVTFEPALERMDSAWSALRKAAVAVPDAKWRRLISAVFAANTWEHYEEHLAWHPAAPTRPR